jgi:hypothetical protein
MLLTGNCASAGLFGRLPAKWSAELELKIGSLTLGELST